MTIHQNVRSTPHGRERMVKMMLSRQTPQADARAAGVFPRTARQWPARYNSEGVAGLPDRSSRPQELCAQTDVQTAERIIALRRRSFRSGSAISISRRYFEISIATTC